MRSYILFFIFGLLTAPVSSRTLYPDSSDEDEITLDIQSVQHAAQILKVLQRLSERSSDVHASPRSYKKPQGIDLDYIGAGAEQYIDVNKLMQLVQKNYEANKNGIWTRAAKTPRVYYISNPEILEEYWSSLKRKDRSDSQYGHWGTLKGKDSSQGVHYDSREQYKAGIDKNLLKFIISQRRDGDGNGEDIYAKDNNRIESNEQEISKQKHGTASKKVNLSSKDNSRKDKEIVERNFKSHDDYYDEKRMEKKKPKSKNKAPTKVRDRGDRSSERFKSMETFKTTERFKTKERFKSIESYKSSWKTKKASSYREPVRTSRRYDEAPERSIYSKPRVAKAARDRGRNIGNAGNRGGYQAYGRTPVPYVGKRGIYEED